MLYSSPVVFQIRNDVCKAFMSLSSLRFLFLLSPCLHVTDPSERALVDTVEVTVTSFPLLGLRLASFLNFLIWGVKQEKGEESQEQTLTVRLCVKWIAVCERTYLCFVSVQLADLLSFALHFQQQPLLLPVKFFPLLIRNAGFQLLKQIILLPVNDHGENI